MSAGVFFCQAHEANATEFCLCGQVPVNLCASCLPEHKDKSAHDVFPMANFGLYRALGNDKAELVRRIEIVRRCSDFLDNAAAREAAVLTEANNLITDLVRCYQGWLDKNHRCFTNLVESLREEVALLMTSPEMTLSPLSQILIEKSHGFSVKEENLLCAIPEEKSLKEIVQHCNQALMKAREVQQQDYENEVQQAFMKLSQGVQQVPAEEVKAPTGRVQAPTQEVQQIPAEEVKALAQRVHAPTLEVQQVPAEEVKAPTGRVQAPTQGFHRSRGQGDVQSSCEKNYIDQKLVLVGDTDTGKTHLRERFAHGKFPKHPGKTVGVDFVTAFFTSQTCGTVKAQIWDTSGQERFRNIIRSHLRNSVGAMIVYDVTNDKTFASVKRWMEELRDQADPNIIIMLVGNKVDLCDGNSTARMVLVETAQRFAKENSLLFEETSAITPSRVNESFEILVQGKSYAETYNKQMSCKRS